MVTITKCYGAIKCDICGRLLRVYYFIEEDGLALCYNDAKQLYQNEVVIC